MTPTEQQHFWWERSINAKNGKKLEMKNPSTFAGTMRASLQKRQCMSSSFGVNKDFIVRTKGAVSWQLIDRYRAALALGMGLSGCQRQLAESYMTRYTNSKLKWLTIPTGDARILVSSMNHLIGSRS